MLTEEERRAPASLALARLVDAARPSLLGAMGQVLRWVIVWALASGATLGLVALTLHPPASHLAELMRYLLIGGLASLAFACGAIWLTDLGRGGVLVKFAAPALLTALIISFNVVLVAQAMFLSPADSVLVLIILVFGTIVALWLALLLARPVSRAIQRVEAGARRMAGGEYGARLPEDGQNGARELDQLAHWFNQMAASVEDAFQRRQRAEDERRQVVAALSHDLRTPLASVRAMIEAITDGVVSDPATVARYQRTIRAEVRHLSSLMDDLFQLSRLEAASPDLPGLQREPLALGDLISDALEAMRTQATRAGIALTGAVEGELPAVCVDARHIHRVLTNLVQNALRHTARGGQIAIHARRERDAAGAPAVVVRVADTGEGIAARDLPHIFEPLYRGEPSRQRRTPPFGGLTADDGADDAPFESLSAGLGLAIARRLIEAHGGTMWAESPLPPAIAAQFAREDGVPVTGPGAAVSFSLPLARN
ncbi:MAG TPA: HAMP domain-containing sensor histidine kinase [Ktedonobacterales bacterium]|jgi:signal transduction histidine kinase